MRSIVALLAGAALSVSGLQMQVLFRNPLAGPYVLGVSAGASLGVALFLLGAPLFGMAISPVWQSLGTAGAAWVGSAVVLVLVVALSRRIKDIMVMLILGMKKERESAKWVMKVIAISSVLVCVLVGGLMFFCENFLGGNEPEVVESIEEDYSFVVYKVQEGEDILCIAIIHSCRQDLIVKYNNLVDGKVYPGMILKIPQKK